MDKRKLQELEDLAWAAWNSCYAVKGVLTAAKERTLENLLSKAMDDISKARELIKSEEQAS